MKKKDTKSVGEKIPKEWEDRMRTMANLLIDRLIEQHAQSFNQKRSKRSMLVVEE